MYFVLSNGGCQGIGFSFYQGAKGLEAIGLELMSVETNCIILLDMSNISYSVTRDCSQRVR